MVLWMLFFQFHNFSMLILHVFQLSVNPVKLSQQICRTQIYTEYDYSEVSTNSLNIACLPGAGKIWVGAGK